MGAVTETPTVPTPPPMAPPPHLLLPGPPTKAGDSETPRLPVLRLPVANPQHPKPSEVVTSALAVLTAMAALMVRRLWLRRMNQAGRPHRERSRDRLGGLSSHPRPGGRRGAVLPGAATSRVRGVSTMGGRSGGLRGLSTAGRLGRGSSPRIAGGVSPLKAGRDGRRLVPASATRSRGGLGGLAGAGSTRRTTGGLAGRTPGRQTRKSVLGPDVAVRGRSTRRGSGPPTRGSSSCSTGRSGIAPEGFRLRRTTPPRPGGAKPQGSHQSRLGWHWRRPTGTWHRPTQDATAAGQGATTTTTTASSAHNTPPPPPPFGTAPGDAMRPPPQATRIHAHAERLDQDHHPDHADHPQVLEAHMTRALTPAQATGHTNSDLTVEDVIAADRDAAEEIAAGADYATGAVQGAELLVKWAETLHAQVTEQNVPGQLAEQLTAVLEQAQRLRSTAKTLQTQLATAVEAVRHAADVAEQHHKPLADAVADAGHSRPADANYHE